MKPHSWIVDAARNKQTLLSDPDFSWFIRTGCDASIVARADDDRSLLHTAWRMPADCDETIVEEILDP